MTDGKKIRKLLLKILGILFSVAMLAFTAASLILAKPQTEKKEAASGQPALNARPALEVKNENDLVSLISDFPAPVMSFMSGSGMTFVSATSSDAAVSGRFGRVASLYWQTPEGVPLILQSIYPADSLSLLEGGYHFSRYSGPTLFGNASVRMEKEGGIRIHTSTDHALYVLILPDSLSGQVSALCRSLQLFTANPQN